MQTSARTGPAAEETRSRILAAAKEIYERNGTRGTTTREVAERAGVNEATLFRHFGNKGALLVAMRESACSLNLLNSVLEARTGDVRTDLRALAGSMIEGMRGQRAMMCISLAEEARTEYEMSGPEWRGPQLILDRLTDFFAVNVEHGVVRGDPKRIATYFMGMCFSYVVARKLWDSHVAKADDIEHMVDLFLNGVR